ncbi:MAG: tail fiber domain-containing protein [Patescibacteria group bacterium]
MQELKRKWQNCKRILPIFLIFGCILFFIAYGLNARSATPPSIITYQGKLLVNGLAATTSQDMYFILYDSASGGTALYTAGGTVGTPTSIAVTPTSGLFSINLGDTGTNTLDPNIFKNNASVFLEVRIGAQTLTPRKQITASPYSFNSMYLDGVASATVSSSTYIPVSDVNGNFNFNSTTISTTTVTNKLTVISNNTSTFNYGATFATAGGQVGIGTTATSRKLTVLGKIYNPIHPDSGINTVGFVFAQSQASELYVSGRYAYVSDRGDPSYLSVIDINRPSAPIKVATLLLSIGRVSSIFVAGNYAYLGAGMTNKLVVVDVTKPASPVQISTTSLGSSSSADSIFVSGKYLYVADTDDTKMYVIDISNPYNPVVVSSVTLDYGPGEIFVSGKYAYLTHTSHLMVVDISNPNLPVQKSTTDLPAGSGAYPIYVSGGYAYLGGTWNNTLISVDIHNPITPVVSSTVALVNAPFDLDISGNYAFVSTYLGIIDIIDISNPGVMSEVGNVYAGDYGVKVVGNYVFSVNDSSGLFFITDLYGTEVGSLFAHSAEVGKLAVQNEIITKGIVDIGTSLTVGYGGILSQGALSISATNTPSYFGGSVGIGTTSPAWKLSVAGDINTTGTYRINNIDYGQYFIATSGYSGNIYMSNGSGRGQWVNTSSLGFASSSGSDSYIQNQSSADQVANFRISSTGTLGALGVNTISPLAKFTIVDGAILATGSVGDTPISGGGTRMMWIPSKAAFRAGIVDGTQWDDALIGDRSVAMGGNTVASGYTSTAMGSRSVASGNYSTALGQYSTASGDNSFALGQYVSSSAFSSIIIGNGLGLGSGLLVNSTDRSLVVGFYSTVPTLFVGPSAGEGTTGRVGVGTTTPTALFSISGSVTSSPFFDIASSSGSSMLRVLANGNVGINTSSPLAGLTIVDGAILAVSSTSGTGAQGTPISGAGTRMMWIPSKAAFRAGSIQGLYAGVDAWDDAKIGLGSVAFGIDTIASGTAAFAAGVGSWAAGNGAVALGNWSTALGTNSFAMGENAHAFASGGIAMGGHITSTASGAIALGSHINVTGSQSFGIGLDTTDRIISASNVMAIMGGNVGIGTTTPQAALTILDGAILAVSSTSGTGAQGTPISGAGTRLMWIPSKAAFRAGYASSTEWDEASIGSYSMALGYNVEASGPYTFASGVENISAGIFSIAMGASNISTGTASVAMGSGNKAQGDGAIALGNNAFASAAKAIAMGETVRALGSRSVAIGEFVTSSGGNSFVMGKYLTVSGANSFGIGLGSSDNGVLSTANTFGIINGAMIASGTTGNTPGSGPGTRMMWIPSKAAFRAGAVGVDTYGADPYGGTEWDDANIGEYSMALGVNNKATALGSVAIGMNNFSGGPLSVAMGFGSYASGTSATALGGSSATGDGSSAFGAATASGTASVAIGGDARALTSFAVAIGTSVTSTAQYSIAMGRYMTVSGANSFGIGLGNSDNGTLSNANTFGIINGAVIASGTIGNTPASGLGTRMMWVPSKAAFRAGKLEDQGGEESIYWDDAKIGSSSVAMGWNVIASNTTAIALGSFAKASGARSVALGDSVIASGDGSMALGFASRATGGNSFAVGYQSYASGTQAIAIGDDVVASGAYSTAMGTRINVTGDRSFGISLNNIWPRYELNQSNVMAIMGGNVGIGTTTPQALFTLQDGAILAAGTVGATPVSGTGTRMMWIPSKAAFRAGKTADMFLGVLPLGDGTGWDEANIGTSSAAFGAGTKASGLYSFAAGGGNTASGTASVALGLGGVAGGLSSFIMGDGVSSGDSSIAMGKHLTATGNVSVAIGDTVVASAGTSFAFGSHVTSSAEKAMALGNYIEVSGTGSIGIGIGNTETHYTVSAINVMAIMGGNVGIGTSSFSYLLNMDGGGYYSAVDGQWHNGSSRSIKQDIVPITETQRSNLLSMLDSLNINQYRFINDVSAYGDQAIWQYGIIADESPDLLTGHDQNSIAAGSAIQFLLTNQQTMYRDLKKLNSTLILSSTTQEITFQSAAVSSPSAKAFTFNAINFNTSTADNYIVSLRSNNDPVFSVSANGDVNTKGNIYAPSITLGTSTNPGDLAEKVDIAVDDNVEPGDVLMVDPSAPDTYRRSNGAYEQSVAGVVSTNPTIIVGNGKTDYMAVMAMVGRVPVKVSNENGPIQRGDLLISASMPGYAMKYDPTKDNNNKMVGIIGVALEPMDQPTGKIMTLIRTGWMYNRDNTIAEIQNSINQIASLQGINLSPSSSPENLGVSQTGGQLSYTGGNLDLQNNTIINVASITGAGGKWRIDADGNLIAKVQTANGSQDLYAMQSTNSELVFSSSSQLMSGTVQIDFDAAIKDVIDPNQPIKISVTLTSGEGNGVYVASKSANGFVVKELNNGNSNATFDWIVVAKRSNAPVTPTLPPIPTPTETPVETPTPAPTPTPTPTTPTPTPETVTETPPSPPPVVESAPAPTVPEVPPAPEAPPAPEVPPTPETPPEAPPAPPFEVIPVSV